MRIENITTSLDADKIIGERRIHSDNTEEIRLLRDDGTFSEWSTVPVAEPQDREEPAEETDELAPLLEFPSSMHEPGAKDDERKPLSALVLGGFSDALQEVIKVGTYGADKYSPNGWMYVDNARDRYANAALRHWLLHMSGHRFNIEDGNVRHMAQVIWNLLAVLEFDLAAEQIEKRDENT